MRLRPLEFVHVIAVGCLGIMAIAFGVAGQLTEWHVLAVCLASLFLVLALMIWLARHEPQFTKVKKVALNFYPAFTVTVIFEALGSLLPAFKFLNRDELLILADRALFGQDPTVWLERFVSPGLTDLLYLAYASYHILPVTLAIILWKKDEAICRQFVFSVSLAFFVNYAGYFLVPAQGPRFTLAHRQNIALEVTPVSQAVKETMNLLEHPKFDAFPSAHAMATVFCLIFSFAHSRRLFYLVLPLAALIVVSTVYCRYHYVVDVIAGALLAAILFPASAKLYRLLNARRGANERLAASDSEQDF